MLRATEPGRIMRLYSLDGIRGLAAFIVVLNHCFLALPDAVAATYIVPLIKWTPLRVIMVGRAAVIIFFVLSGLALGLSLLRGTQPSYWKFVVRRICRIYPSLIAAILFSATLYHLAQPHPIDSLTLWFNHNWSEGAGLDVVLAHIALINRPQDVSLDTVIWSLAYEMRISLIIPALLMLALGVGARMFMVLMLTLAVAVEVWLRFFGIESGAYHNIDIVSAVLATLHYVPFFGFGLLIAVHLARFKAFFAGLPLLANVPLWLFAGATLTQYSDYICGTGAVVIIGLVLSSPRIGAFLETPVIGWLGRVSYSLYLFHLPILLFAVHRFHGELPAGVYLAAAVFVSLVVAEIAYRLIEAPSMEWGRVLTRRKPALLAAESHG